MHKYTSELRADELGIRLLDLRILAACSATLRVFKEKNPKKNPQKIFKKKFQTKIPKKNSQKKFPKNKIPKRIPQKFPEFKKKICLNSYACNSGSACEKFGGLGLLV
jgi:hypothetical protein